MARRLTLCFDRDEVSWNIQEDVTSAPPCQLVVDIDRLDKSDLLRMLESFREWTLATLLLDAADRDQVVVD